MKKLWACLFGFLLLASCSSGRTPSKTAGTKAVRARIVQEAVQQERTARKHRGKEAAEAWYKAGKLWVHPDNPKKSYERALTCFHRVDRKKANAEIAEDTRSWISVLTQLLTAKETAASLKDAVEGSERLRRGNER